MTNSGPGPNSNRGSKYFFIVAASALGGAGALTALTYLTSRFIYRPSDGSPPPIVVQDNTQPTNAGDIIPPVVVVDPNNDPNNVSTAIQPYPQADPVVGGIDPNYDPNAAQALPQTVAVATQINTNQLPDPDPLPLVDPNFEPNPGSKYIVNNVTFSHKRPLDSRYSTTEVSLFVTPADAEYGVKMGQPMAEDYRRVRGRAGLGSQTPAGTRNVVNATSADPSGSGAAREYTIRIQLPTALSKNKMKEIVDRIGKFGRMVEVIGLIQGTDPNYAVAKPTDIACDLILEDGFPVTGYKGPGGVMGKEYTVMAKYKDMNVGFLDGEFLEDLTECLYLADPNGAVHDLRVLKRTYDKWDSPPVGSTVMLNRDSKKAKYNNRRVLEPEHVLRVKKNQFTFPRKTPRPRGRRGRVR